MAAAAEESRREPLARVQHADQPPCTTHAIPLRGGRGAATHPSLWLTQRCQALLPPHATSWSATQTAPDPSGEGEPGPLCPGMHPDCVTVVAPAILAVSQWAPRSQSTRGVSGPRRMERPRPVGGRRAGAAMRRPEAGRVLAIETYSAHGAKG
jgi:hypothetical protein